jgi:hypothetical protein
VTKLTEADAENECHMSASIHSQVGRFTTEIRVGLNRLVGSGRSRVLAAVSATDRGSICGAAVEPSAIHTVDVVDMPVERRTQVTEYQLPGLLPPEGKPPASLSASFVYVQLQGSPPRVESVLPVPPPSDPPSEAPTVTEPLPSLALVSPPNAGAARWDCSNPRTKRLTIALDPLPRLRVLREGSSLPIR